MPTVLTRPRATAAPGERTGALHEGQWAAAARTDKGGRPHNEDAFVCRPDLGVFAVIDGMGGQQAGETAAAVAREALLREPTAVKGLCAANDEVLRRADDDAGLRGMGCVASVLRVEGDDLVVAHVGDTRVYVASNAGCEQLTRDHTLAARRQEDLGLDDRRARELGGHNQVTRDIGGQPRGAGDGWIDRALVELEGGELFVLCSDGLHGVVPAEELFRRLREARREGTPPDVLADRLVELALERGTRDNVTVVVVRAEAEAPNTEPVPLPARRRRRSSRRPWLLFVILAASAAALARYGDFDLLVPLVRQLTSGGW